MKNIWKYIYLAIATLCSQEAMSSEPSIGKFAKSNIIDNQSSITTTPFAGKKSFVMFEGSQDYDVSKSRVAKLFDEISVSTNIIESFLPSKEQNLILVKFHEVKNGESCWATFEVNDSSSLGLFVDENAVYGVLNLNRKDWLGANSTLNPDRCIFSALAKFYGFKVPKQDNLLRKNSFQVLSTLSWCSSESGEDYLNCILRVAR